MKRARARVLVELALLLPEWQRGEVLTEAMAAARSIKEEGLFWDKGYKERVLEDKTWVLGELAQHLPEWQRGEVLTEAMAAARRIWDKEVQARVLGELALRLPESQRSVVLTEAMAATRRIQDTRVRARVLGELPLHLPESQRSVVLTEALAAAQIDMLGKLVPHLPAALLVEVLAVTRTIRGSGEWTEGVLDKLVPYLPPALLGEALAVAQTIRDQEHRARALGELALHLPEAYLPESQRSVVLTEAMAATRMIISNTWDQLRALGKLAPHLPEGQQRDEVLAGIRAEVIELARSHRDTWRQVWDEFPMGMPEQPGRDLGHREEGDLVSLIQSLDELAPHLPEMPWSEILAEVLGEAQSMKDVSYRAEALGKLAPHLPEGQQREVLLAEALAGGARLVEYAKPKTESLGELASYLPEAQRSKVRKMLAEALTAVQAIEEKGDRAEALGKLAPHLPEALAQLYTLWDETLPALANRTRSELLSAIHALVPVIYALGGEKAIVETFHAIQDVGRWWP